MNKKVRFILVETFKDDSIKTIIGKRERKWLINLC